MDETSLESYVEQANAWILADPDPVTQAELQALVFERNAGELRERFAGPLEFGTAGLRGIVAAGPSRMNRAVVIRTTRGLADHLLTHEPDARARPVILGYDARTSSRQFAEDTAGVLAAAGLTVRFFPEPAPTPLIAFAARQLSAVAAIAITASHNPPEYNGYKVYASNAAQIIPPTDHEIAARIEKVARARDVPRLEHALDIHSVRIEPVPTTIFDRYWMELAALRQMPRPPAEIAIVYTPLHGVGGRYARMAFERAGYGRVDFVSEQSEPDGRFPTVRFPNPEEPGALDLATALARKVHADLIIANDPDADRLAVSLPGPSDDWIALTGNQIGLLLADFLLASTARTPRPLVASSIVSSPMLGSIAKKYGARFEQTLTGFKWIWNAALELEQKENVRFAFGYEEALGYSAGHLVRDKDGISTAVLFADLVSASKARGQTIWQRLEALYREHGLWVSVQKSVVRPGTEGLAEIDRAMETLAASAPTELGPRRVERTVDFRRGADLRPRWLPATSMIELDLAGGARVLVRPSGTEPKLKVYVDLSVPLGGGASARESESKARTEAEAIAEALISKLGFR